MKCKIVYNRNRLNLSFQVTNKMLISSKKLTIRADKRHKQDVNVCVLSLWEKQSSEIKFILSQKLKILPSILDLSNFCQDNLQYTHTNKHTQFLYWFTQRNTLFHKNKYYKRGSHLLVLFHQTLSCSLKIDESRSGLSEERSETVFYSRSAHWMCYRRLFFDNMRQYLD